VGSCRAASAPTLCPKDAGTAPGRLSSSLYIAFVHTAVGSQPAAFSFLQTS